MMKPASLLLILLASLSMGISKPTDEDENQSPGQGENNVVNMAVNQEQGAVADQQPDAKSEPENSNNNPPDEKSQNEPNPSNVENTGTVVADSPAVEEDGTKGEHNNAETPGEQKTHLRDEEDIDWGIADDKKGLPVGIDLAAIKQQTQQEVDNQGQAEQQEDKQYEQQREQHNERAQEQHETAQEQHETAQEQHAEQQHVPEEDRTEREKLHQDVPEHKRDGHDGVGVQEPEHLVHGDDHHEDHHSEGLNKVSAEDAKAENDRQAELRFQSEQDELQGVQPKVIGNVHDGTARKVAEFMKNQQFGPGDVDEAIHGGGHVHGEKTRESQAGNAEFAAHGEDGAHDHKEEKDTGPLAVDPDELMHEGQGHGHVHDAKSDNAAPGALTPEDALATGHDHPAAHAKEKEVPKGPIGTEYETIIHDGAHVHDKVTGNHKPKNRVRYQDIIELGLNEETLKGIDLSKLLEQEKRELEGWHKETESRLGDVDSELSDSERSASFWQKQVTDLRKTYLEKLYAKVRHISNPDLDTAEWDTDDDNVRGLRDSSAVHEGESALEHEMEMWASTISKGERKPYKELQKKWKQGQQAGEKGVEDVGANVATGGGQEVGDNTQGGGDEDQDKRDEVKEDEGQDKRDDVKGEEGQDKRDEVKGEEGQDKRDEVKGEEGGIQGEGNNVGRGEDVEGDVVQDNTDAGRVLGGENERTQEEGNDL